MNPVGERLGPAVLLGPVGVEFARRALLVALDMHKVNARAVPDGLLALAGLVGAAVPGSEGLPAPASAASCASDDVDTKEAAVILGCKVRNVRDLKDRGVLQTGRIIGGRLLFLRTELLAEAARRQEARSA